MNRGPAGPPRRLEVWGGIECSAVRVAHGLVDQLERTGHVRRIEDLDRVAELGIRTLRYPLLWDRHAGAAIDWRWPDERLARLRALGIRPIVGLLHHGCGPLRNGFLDPGFVTGIARFARQVAERYPWLDAYTPVNEPLTTARFGGTYGLWHPFRTDAPSFARIFLRQCQAVRAAMAAIRTVNPRAELVQTEDVGKTHSTPALAYQAEFENERRWLTFDLLAGRLTPDLPLFGFLESAGIPTAELEDFLENPCPPDVLGMNHYVTSERLLDDRLDGYPPEMHGGNGRSAYVDVPAVRVRLEGLAGPAALLRELWDRHARPIAITEVQLACAPDEQVRWLDELWRAAEESRREGVDVRAVTAWSLFGAYDWDSLLTRHSGYYENGAFDVRTGVPVATPLAGAIRDLAARGRIDHPWVRDDGWWRRPDRFTFEPVSCPEPRTVSAGRAFSE